MDIVIRYVFKHRFSGNIEIRRYSIRQLEERSAQKLSPCFNETEYEMIARDLSTGLKDRNGTEIFINDIDVSNEPMFVAYYDGKFGLSVYGYFDSEINWKHVDIGGNIYQNPDLLKEEAR
ncbi:hypothetical protein EVS87_002670 [Bacillus altitudinis]|uniref:YopX family protein n=1 Tax=Bacillus altitudinis TaxID=293387 RepID=UPI0010723D45|nr:YopX family protein [Bacillus altitudinis]QEO61144.1 hypothetical protein EVS87_002670 [Bacillus altitudinis]